MKHFFTRVLAVVSFACAFTYFVSCLTPYISPVHFWPMAFLALGFPYIAAVIFLLAFFWLFIRKKAALFLFVLFLAGYKNLASTFAVHKSEKPVEIKERGSLRILTWNVRGFDNPSASGDSANSIRRQMFNYINKVKPDVSCLQEFSEHIFPGVLSNTAELKRLGYAYFFRTNELPHYYPDGTILSGTAIFSRVPIIAFAKTLLGDTSYTEYLASVDVLLQNKPVRIFATHFKSLNLFAGPVDTSNQVIFHGNSRFVYDATKFQKLKIFAQDHAKEALIAKKAVNKSPYPVVAGIDMNSVPASFPYHTMSAGLQDAFTLSGFGLGTTLDSLPKTLRIDFLLVDKKLTIKNYRKDELHLSDHFPQVIDVLWKKN